MNKKIDLKEIKKYLIPAVVVVVVVVVVLMIIAINSCNVIDKLSEKNGEYKATVETVTKEKENLLKDIDAQKAIITAKDTEIADYKTKAAEKEGKIKELDNQLPQISEAIKTAKTDTERIPLFEKKVEIWTGKFTLSNSEIEDKNKEIAAWEVKFNAQVKISIDNKTGWDNAENKALKCEAVQLELEKRLKKARFFSKVKTGLVAVAAGYVVYNLIKK